MTERVVITGYGCLTAVGENFEQTWKAIQEGRTGISRITLWDTTEWQYYLGAEINNYQPEKMLKDRKLQKMMSRHDMIGLCAVKQALEQSHLTEYQQSLNDPTEFNHQTGIYVASGGVKFHQLYDFLPLFYHSQRDNKCFAENLTDFIHPMWLLRILPNNVLAYIGIQYGFRGSNQNIVNHGISGIQAIAEAFYAIRTGCIERAIVVGYETQIEQQNQMYYASLGVLSCTHLLPFDASRNGTLLGEGSGCLILESFRSALSRGATIYGEILGTSVSCEALGIFSISDDGLGIVRSVQKALQEAQLSPQSIGLVTAHGNGTLNSDSTEANALSNLFSLQVPVTGFKWSLGHTVAAAGVIESILTLQALNEKRAPGIASLQQQGKDCEGIRISKDPQIINQPFGVVINRGFGSLNAALVLSSTNT